MIISDFAKLARTPTVPKDHKEEIDEGLNLIRLRGMSDELKQHCRSGYGGYRQRESREREVDEHGALTQLSGRFDNSLNGIRQSIYAESGAVPRALLGDDPLSLASQCPRITLAELRRLADVLGFVVIPFEYLKGQSWDREEHNVRRAIDKFSKVPIHKSYVLCPVDFYDVEGHIKHEKDLPIYAGAPNSQAFMALSMTIPSFRAIRKDIDELDQRTKNLEDRINSLGGEIKALHDRVEQLARQVDDQQRAMLAQQVQIAAQAQQIEAMTKRLERVEYICAHDPLMVNLHKDQQITDKDGLAVVGPCWGSDFATIVTELMKLKKVKGQRTKVRNCFLRFSEN